MHKMGDSSAPCDRSCMQVPVMVYGWTNDGILIAALNCISIYTLKYSVLYQCLCIVLIELKIQCDSIH